MPKKDGLPKKVELRVMDKIRRGGGQCVLTYKDGVPEYTASDGSPLTTSDQVIPNMIKLGWLRPTSPGLFAGADQSWEVSYSGAKE